MIRETVLGVLGKEAQMKAYHADGQLLKQKGLGELNRIGPTAPATESAYPCLRC